MESELDRERQQAHALVDMLSAEKLTTVRTLLEMLAEPLEPSPAPAPGKEEGTTPEAAAAEDRASPVRGEGIPPEELLREFGLNR